MVYETCVIGIEKAKIMR